MDANPFANATIMGLEKGPETVWLNGQVIGEELWEYDGEKEVLRLQGLEELFPHGAWADGWQINWE